MAIMAITISVFKLLEINACLLNLKSKNMAKMRALKTSIVFFMSVFPKNENLVNRLHLFDFLEKNVSWFKINKILL